MLHKVLDRFLPRTWLPPAQDPQPAHPGNASPWPPAPGRAVVAMVQGHPEPFSLAEPPSTRTTGDDPFGQARQIRSTIARLPPRNDDSGPMHTTCLLAILAQDDPVVRRDLFLHYARRHRFPWKRDNTIGLFLLVSHLQKPEHRSTVDTWKELEGVCSPGPATTWSVWRGLCRVLAVQMADVIQAFQQSRQSPSNHRRFNGLVLRVVLRLAAPEACDAATAGKRQLELLSDLAQAISADHRLTCLCLLENTCALWIEVATQEHPEHPMHAKELAQELALLAALRTLIAQLRDPSPQARL